MSKLNKGISKTIDAVLAIILLLLAFSILSSTMTFYTNAAYTPPREYVFDVVDLIERFQRSGFIYQGIVKEKCNISLGLFTNVLDTIGYPYVINVYTINEDYKLEHLCTLSSTNPLAEEYWYSALYIPPEDLETYGYVLEVYISP